MQIECGADRRDDVDISPFRVAADVVSLARPAVLGNHGKRAGMIVDKQPVADVPPLAVNRQRQAGEPLDNYQRNELLRKLVRAIII